MVADDKLHDVVSFTVARVVIVPCYTCTSHTLHYTGTVGTTSAPVQSFWAELNNLVVVKYREHLDVDKFAATTKLSAIICCTCLHILCNLYRIIFGRHAKSGR